jgi:gamma-glutamyl-gamma-aminobutyrate hydrolase PuuD
VQSSHHQGVGSVGEGLVETAWAEDGSLEGVEDPDRRFAVGVLWHPEMEEDKRLFEALVAEARRYREERAPASPKPGTVTDFSRTPSPRAVREVAD